MKAHKKAKEGVERLKQLVEEEEESHRAFKSTVASTIQRKQNKCTRAEARAQKFRQSVAHGAHRMQGKLEVTFRGDTCFRKFLGFSPPWVPQKQGARCE